MASLAPLGSGSASLEGGRSELLRGIPDFRNMQRSSSKKGTRAAVNPIPANVQKNGQAPKNGHEFARELKRRRTFQEKFVWLATISDQAYAEIFRVEIDAQLLQALVALMHDVVVKKVQERAAAPAEQGCGEDTSAGSWEFAQFVDASRNFLGALCRHCPRALDFAASFQTAQDRATAEELLRELEKASGDKAQELADEFRAIRAGLLLEAAAEASAL